uniref:Uncharacterized protein n=1 Tax=Arundo donax TaxID=35708 RepID=A0A0A9HGA2_ARUDO
MEGFIVQWFTLDSTLLPLRVAVSSPAHQPSELTSLTSKTL